MVDMGLYKAGANPELDDALHRAPQITQFLRQGLREVATPKQVREQMSAVLMKTMKAVPYV